MGPIRMNSRIFHARKLVQLACSISLLTVAAFSHAGTAKDPTVPPASWLAAEAARGQQGGVSVDSVNGGAGRVTVLGAKRRLAVIDGKVVKAGDPLNGSRVVAVQRDKVVTEDESRSLIIAPNVRKAPTTRVSTTKKAVVLPAVATTTATGDNNEKQ